MKRLDKDAAVTLPPTLKSFSFIPNRISAHVVKENSAQTHLLTRSCNFCIGSGSPSRPQVRISLPSYTLMIRSAVFMRKQLEKEEDVFCFFILSFGLSV